MNATSSPASATTLTERARMSLWLELFKARLTLLVLMTTAVGYYLGSRTPMDGLRFFWVLLGTGCLACAAAALNQWQEQAYDARMVRTRERPLPSQRLQPATAFVVGSGLALAGLGLLLACVGGATAILGAITLLVYVLIYTPLKRITPLNTVVGAIPGALPPLMGWTAARGALEPEGWSLFAILAFWQLPHFLAIAWMYREDYARAGFAMLPVFDTTGQRTGAHALAHTLGLLSVSLSPFVLGLVGVVYLAGALALGAAFFWMALGFARQPTHARARQLFYASILYLPFLLGLMVADKN